MLGLTAAYLWSFAATILILLQTSLRKLRVSEGPGPGWTGKRLHRSGRVARTIEETNAPT
jgi:hypothetical protein